MTGTLTLDAREESSTLLCRGSQSPLDAPLSPNTLFDGSSRKPKFPIPLALSKSLTVKGDFMDETPIVHLGDSVCPSTVGRFIVPIVVDSIEAHTVRTRSHVFKKGLETIFPSIAHGNASKDVVFSRLSIGIKGSFFGSAPSLVFDGSSEPVLEVPASSDFFDEATATLGITSQKIPSIYGLSSTAFTDANPSDMALESGFMWSNRFNRKPSEPISNFY